MKNWELWAKGLLSAVIGGVANSITVMIVDPMAFNLGEGLPKLAKVCIVSMIISAALYLKQSPLPPENGKLKIPSK